MTRAYVALGANLDDPIATVHSAIEALHDLPRSQLLATSSLYRTAPIGLHNQPDFVNAVAAIETQLRPHELLAELFGIEARFGRRRSVPNAPRTLDLDLLLHGGTVLEDPLLTLPHPRMHERAFVLAPLAEIASDLVLPRYGAIAELLRRCEHQRIEALTVRV